MKYKSMDIGKQLRLIRSFGLIAYLLIMIPWFYVYLHEYVPRKTNIVADLIIYLGLILIAGLFIFLSYNIGLKLQIYLRDNAKSLDPKNYHFFMLDFHKSFGLTAKDSILKNLSKSAKEVMSPEEFELFTQKMTAKRPIEKRKIVNVILALIILILVLILAINFFIHQFFVDGPISSNLSTFSLPVICSEIYLLSFQNQSVLNRLNVELEKGLRSNQ